MRAFRWSAALGTVCLGTLVACSGGAGSANDSQEAALEEADGVHFTDGEGNLVEPVAMVEFPSGAGVSFVERGPDDLVVVQWGPNMADPPVGQELAEQRLSPVELFERLSGDDAPAGLVAAQERRDAAAKRMESQGGADVSEDERLPDQHTPTSASGDSGQPPEGVSQTKQPLWYYDCQGSMGYDEWFNCNFCAPNSGVADYDITWMWVSGDGSFTRSDKNHTWSTVSVYAGGTLQFSVGKRPWYSWSWPLNVNIANGYYAGKELGWDYVDFDTRNVVQNASGDSYHWCSYGWAT